jgi:CelD/BcsL family acetyltransferase involved in cellulose biosynthesis
MTIVEGRADADVGSTAMVAAVHRGGVEVVERWADDWRKLCAESVDDQPFYHPEWIAAHIRAFTPQAKVVLLTVSSQGKLLFVLPLLQEWSVFSGILLRKLRAPVNSHSCRFDAVRHSSSQGDAAVAIAWNHLQKLPGWDMLELHDVPEAGTISALVLVAGSNGLQTAQVPMRRNPYVPVPTNLDDLKKLPLNARLRGKLRHIRRELDTHGGLKFRRIEQANRVALDRFYELESAGWKGAEGSAIACNPQIRQFYDEVSQAAERFGYLSLYSLELDGELLASHFGLAHKGRYFSPKIAYNEKFPQYAPGHLIVSEILQDCAARGISEYDITGINDEWKMKWTSEVRAKFMYFVFRQGLPGTLAHTLRFKLRPAVKKLLRFFMFYIAGSSLHLLFRYAPGMGRF